MDKKIHSAWSAWIEWRQNSNARTALDVLGLAILLLLLFAVAEIAHAEMRIGALMPSITLSGVNGIPVRIPEHVKGKVIVLHFWQIGCSSCKLEMPAMNVLYNKYRDKGLEILAVNLGQQKESVKAFAAELGVSYPILIDAEQKCAGLYGVTDVPRTYVIDRSGVIRYRIFGGATPEKLKQLVLSLL
jgi:peroxiredoxin